MGDKAYPEGMKGMGGGGASEIDTDEGEGKERRCIYI